MQKLLWHHEDAYLRFFLIHCSMQNSVLTKMCFSGSFEALLWSVKMFLCFKEPSLISWLSSGMECLKHQFQSYGWWK